MILIGLGSNMAGPWGSPRQTLQRALEELAASGIGIRRCSRWVRSRPLGPVAQADFLNGAAIVESHLPPAALLRRTRALERRAGRTRARRWGPRPLDIDLLDYHGRVQRPPRPRAVAQRAPMSPFSPLTLPHPGLICRPFVLAPLAEIAPRWHHPLTGLTAAIMLHRLHVRQGGAIID